MDRYLALDQGGTSSRALVFDADGAVVARGQRPVTEVRVGSDRVEQDPDELVASIEGAIADAGLARGVGAPAPVCAGLATQRASLVCWDRATGAALSPVLSWQDRRAADRLEPVRDRAEDVRARTGLHLSPHYGATKMAWCLEHLPAVKRAREEGRLVIGPLASFLAGRLTAGLTGVPSCCALRCSPLGRPGGLTWLADPANASRTQLWNIGTGDWDAELCRLFGVPAALLPRCVPTRHAFGTIRSGADRVPLSIVTGDQSAALFAQGAPAADTAYANFGTGAFVLRPFADPAIDAPRLLKSVLMRDAERVELVLEGTINGAGSAIHWAQQELGIGDALHRLGEWLAVETTPPLFLNGVSGLAAPFWVSDFPTQWVGEGGAAARVVAVAESVLFLVGTILDEMAVVLPRPARIVASGGLSRVDALCERLAAIAGVPVERSEETEATAAGLAWLLGARRSASPVVRRFLPTSMPALETRFAHWRVAMAAALAAA